MNTNIQLIKVETRQNRKYLECPRLEKPDDLELYQRHFEQVYGYPPAEYCEFGWRVYVGPIHEHV